MNHLIERHQKGQQSNRRYQDPNVATESIHGLLSFQPP